MKTTRHAAHALTILHRGRAPSDTQFCGKSWKVRHECPVCGRSLWINTNYLGARIPVCLGTKTVNVAERAAFSVIWERVVAEDPTLDNATDLVAEAFDTNIEHARMIVSRNS